MGKKRQRGAASLGWTLCFATAACLAAIFFLLWREGGQAHDGQKSLMFIKLGLFDALLTTSAICTVLLLVWFVCGLVKRSNQTGQLAVALALSFYMYPMGLLVFIGLTVDRSCSWEVEQHIKGIDNRSYYILHASPPLNGPGHSTLARRTGGNSLFYTMNIIGGDYGSAHYDEVLSAGLTDPNPEMRRTCRMLLRTLKLRRAAAKRNP